MNLQMDIINWFKHNCLLSHLRTWLNHLARFSSASILVLIIFLGGCNKAKNNANQNTDTVDSLTLFGVRSFARSHFLDSIPNASKTKVFTDFDFSSFKGLKESNANDYSVEVYYNEQNGIVKIRRTSNLPDNDFEFRVAYGPESKYVVLYAEEFFDQYESEYIYGFFLLYENACYFISFDNPFCLMQLDSRLNPIQTLQFKSDKLVYRTKINYRDSIHLYSESFFKPTSHFSVNGRTKLNDVTRYFHSGNAFVFEKELVLGLIPELDYIPLWTFEGHHEYDLSVRPKMR